MYLHSGCGQTKKDGKTSSWEPSVMTTLAKFAHCESGATSIEYGLIAAFISIVLVASVRMVGQTIDGTFQNVNAGFP